MEHPRPEGLALQMGVEVTTDRVTPEKASTVCNAVGKMLRLVEMECRRGAKEDPDGRGTVRLDTLPAHVRR